MAETVYKGCRRKGFTTVYREVAQDARLSLKARGLFLLMQSLPEDWNYTIAGLAELANTGKDQIRSGLRELLEVGYLVKEQAHDSAGKFTGNVFILQENAPPLSGNPTTEKPTTENPLPENPTQQNNNIHIPPISPKGDVDLDMLFDRFWIAYPKKKAKAAAKKAWDKLKPSMELCRTMSAALDKAKRSEAWTKNGGQYIPYPATWINGRRWEDEVVPDKEAPVPEARAPRYVRTEIVNGEERDIYE